MALIEVLKKSEFDTEKATLEASIAAKADASALNAHTSSTSNPHSVSKSQVGLANVDNTSDADKPVSTAQQAALNGKADTAHTHDDRYYTETETDSLLGEKVDQTEFDTFESAVNTALAGKADSGHNHDGVYAPLARALPAGGTAGQVLQKVSGTDYDVEWDTVSGGGGGDMLAATYDPQEIEGDAFDLSLHTGSIPQSQVTDLTSDLAGKANAVHTHDDRYYTETETDTLLAAKAAASDLTAHEANSSNPHSVTAAQVGLGNVDNTSDTNKPVSTAQQAALDDKADLLVTTNVQSGTSYTLQDTDPGLVIEFTNASAVTITIPANSTEAIPVGSVISLCQMGAGAVSIVAAGGVTLRVCAEFVATLAGQYAEATLRKRATNEWVLSGALELA